MELSATVSEAVAEAFENAEALLLALGALGRRELLTLLRAGRVAGSRPTGRTRRRT